MLNNDYEIEVFSIAALSIFFHILSYVIFILSDWRIAAGFFCYECFRCGIAELDKRRNIRKHAV